MKVLLSQFFITLRGNDLEKNEKTFLSFLIHFWNFQQILNSVKKNKVVIAHVVRKLKNLEDLVRPHTKRRCLRTSFDS